MEILKNLAKDIIYMIDRYIILGDNFSKNLEIKKNYEYLPEFEHCIMNNRNFWMSLWQHRVSPNVPNYELEEFKYFYELVIKVITKDEINIDYMKNNNLNNINSILNETDEEYYSKWYFCNDIIKYKNEKLYGLLIDEYFNFDLLHCFGRFVLNNEIDIIKFLLKNDIFDNMSNYDEGPVLIMLLCCGHYELFKIIYNYGIIDLDVNIYKWRYHTHKNINHPPEICQIIEKLISNYDGQSKNYTKNMITKFHL